MFDTNVDECLILVTSKEHKRFGQVARLRAHDWRETGTLYVNFLDGKEESFSDGLEKDGPKSLVENIYYRNFIKRLNELVGREGDLFYMNLNITNKRFGQPAVIFEPSNTLRYFRAHYIDGKYEDYMTIEHSTPKYEANLCYPCLLGDERDLIRGIYLLTNDMAKPNSITINQGSVWDELERKVS